MRVILVALAATALLGGAASADPWKDESGNKPWKDRGGYAKYDRAYKYDRDYKEEFWDGDCKIERKWEPGGGYKEEVKCEGWK